MKVVLLCFFALACATSEMYLKCLQNCDWSSTTHEIKGCIQTCQMLHKPFGKDSRQHHQIDALVQRRYDELVKFENQNKK